MKLKTARGLCFEKLWMTAVVLAPLLVPNLHAATLHVWQDSPNPTPPYTNWATAAHVIQEAVDAAANGDTVLVTNGTYQTGGRAVFGTMINRVAVTKPLMVRSVDGPNVTVIAGAEAPGGGSGEGAIRGAYLTNGAALVGFTLTQGATRSEGDYARERSGAGLWCENFGVVSNCVITGNSAAYDGGGAYHGIFHNSTFRGNSSGASGGGVHGGALYNCVLTGNDALFSGGGAYAGILRNCLLFDNEAGNGGGTYSATLNNCTVIGNRAEQNGGGTSLGSVRNSIVYFNSAPTTPNYNGGFFTYSCSTPLPAGGDNIDADPQLVSVSHLSGTSPCVGIGNALYTSGVDIDGEAWLDPPSLGADQFIAGQATGPMVVTIKDADPIVNLGDTNVFIGLIEGRISSSVWDFGDSSSVTNQPLASHAWSQLGVHTVTLRAFNDTFPEGISASIQVTVKDPDLIVDFEDTTTRRLDESESAVSLVVTRFGEDLSAFMVDYATMDGTAMAGEDYVAATGTLEFDEGERSKTITIDLLNDTWREADQELSVRLINTSGAWSLGQAEVFIVIVDNDPGLSFIQETRRVNESANIVSMTVLRGADDQAPFTVDYATMDDTAMAGTDYVAAAGTLEFAEGELSKMLTIELSNDGMSEGEERFTVHLSNPTGERSLDPGRNRVTIIIDDNDPGVGFDQNSTLVNESQSNVLLTVLRGSDILTAFTVEYSTEDGSALAGQDYLATNGILEFADGEQRKELVIQLLNDVERENTEQFFVKLAANMMTIHIQDNDPGVGFTQVTRRVSESQNAVQLTVLRGSDDLTAFTVDFATMDGTATAGEDYVAAAGTLEFAEGEPSKTVAIELGNDALREIEERFTLHLSNPSGEKSLDPGKDAATLIIEDNDPGVGFTQVTWRVSESQNTVQLTVLRGSDDLTAFTVDFATMDGTATAGEDYVAVAGTLEFAEGESSKAVTIELTNDALREGEERFTVHLSNPSGEKSLDPGRDGATIIIDDNDPGTGFAQDTRRVGELQSTVSLTVLRGSDDLSAFTVDFATIDGTATAGEDYVAAAGTLEFAEGESSKTVTIELTNDALTEGEERFTVHLSNPSGEKSLDPGRDGATIIIDDNDPGVGFEQDRTWVNESQTNVSLIVLRGSDDLSAFTVGYATEDGTAVAGQDYMAATGFLEFAEGEQRKELVIQLLNDSERENQEDFLVWLAEDIATIRIEDNDPGIGFSGSSASTYEYQETLQISVRRGSDMPGSFEVDFATVDGTALAGQDYMATNGTLSFLEGEDSKALVIPLLNDDLFEEEETFYVHLSNPTQGHVLNPDRDSVSARIRDNDQGVGFTGSTYYHPENGGSLQIMVQRRTDYSGAFQVNFETRDTGQAIPGEDYVEIAGVLEFAEGEMSRSIEVEILNDDQTEAWESFELLLSNVNVPGVEIYRASVTFRIEDNDPGIGFDVAEIQVSETAASVAIMVHRGADSIGAFTVEYATLDVLISGQRAYQPASGMIMFGQGVNTQTVEIILTGDDAIWEGDDEFEVVLDLPTSVGVLDQASNTVRVIVADNEPFEWEIHWVGDPFPEVGSLRAVTWGNGQYVVLGEEWAVVSNDIKEWESQHTPGLQARDVLWANDEYVAVGFSGVWRSMDGLNWTNAAASFSNNLWRISYGDGVYVVLDQGEHVWTSTNLVDWTTTQLGPGLRDLAHGDAGFVVTSYEGKAWYLQPGQPWEALGEITSGDLGAVAWGDQGYVTLASGYDETNQVPYVDLLHSMDGRSWQTARLEGDIYYGANRIFYAEGAYVTLSWDGSRRLRYQTNQWVIDGRSQTSFGDLRGFGPDDMAYGSAGYFGVSWSDAWRSQDALTWERIGRFDLSDVHVAESGVFTKHIEGDGFHSSIFDIRSSGDPDLDDWRPEASGGFSSGTGSGLVSLNGVVGDLRGGILHLRSLEGEWSQISFTNGWIRDVTTGAGQWVVVGRFYDPLLGRDQLTVLRSTNAVTWELSSLNFEGDFYQIAHAGEWFFAMGDEYGVGRGLWISRDAIEWQRSNWDANFEWYSVAYGKGIYVAAARQQQQDQRVFLRSIDGMNWEVTRVLDFRDVYAADLEYGSGYFAATWRGWRGRGSREGVRSFLSRDGVVWKRHSPLPGVFPSALDYSDGRLLAVGNAGLLLRSPVLVHFNELHLDMGGQLTAVVEGETGREYTVLGSIDLADWMDLETLTLTQSVQQITLPTLAPATTRSFYRLRVSGSD